MQQREKEMLERNARLHHANQRHNEWLAGVMERRAERRLTMLRCGEKAQRVFSEVVDAEVPTKDSLLLCLKAFVETFALVVADQAQTFTEDQKIVHSLAAAWRGESSPAWDEQEQVGGA